MYFIPKFSVRLNNLAAFSQNSERMQREELLVKLVYSVQQSATKAVENAENFLTKVYYDCPHNDKFICPLEAIRILTADTSDPVAKIQEYTNAEGCKPRFPNQAAKKLYELVQLYIETDNPSLFQLEKVLGMKTSHLYWMTIDQTARVAALDVHILRFLGHTGTFPSRTKYLELEEKFIREADNRGITPFELDQIVWQTAANNK